MGHGQTGPVAVLSLSISAFGTSGESTGSDAIERCDGHVLGTIGGVVNPTAPMVLVHCAYGVRFAHSRIAARTAA